LSLALLRAAKPIDIEAMIGDITSRRDTDIRTPPDERRPWGAGSTIRQHMRAVAEQLRGCTVIRDGIVNRAFDPAQRRYFEPPLLEGAADMGLAVGVFWKARAQTS
jgi:hypothetical protein